MKYLAYLVVTVTLFFAHCGAAYALDLVNAQFKGSKFYNKRDPIEPRYTLLAEGHSDAEYGTAEAWNHEIGLDLDTDLFRTDYGYMYWDQNLVGQSTTTQYRRMYWEFEFGLKDNDNKFGIFWNHKSDHLLDSYVRDYPLHDVYGITFCLMKVCKR